MCAAPRSSNSGMYAVGALVMYWYSLSVGECSVSTVAETRPKPRSSEKATIFRKKSFTDFE